MLNKINILLLALFALLLSSCSLLFSGQSDNASVTIKLGKSTLKSISRSGGGGDCLKTREFTK